MPKTRKSALNAQSQEMAQSNLLEETFESDLSDANVTAMEQMIIAEKKNHETEMALRKELYELKKKHRTEIAELEKSFGASEEIKLEDKEPTTEQNTTGAISKSQFAARKAICTTLPKFCGEPDVWPLFISSFRTTTEACGFSDLENMKRLMDSLGGEALEAVKGRLIFPQSVPNVIRDLENLFGRPRTLLKSLLQKIRDTASPTENRLESFITFGVRVKQMCDHLLASDMKDHLNNPLLVEELVEKLPPRYKLEWAKYKRDKTESILTIFGDYIQTIMDDVSEVVEYIPEKPVKPLRMFDPKSQPRVMKSHGSTAQMRNYVHELKAKGSSSTNTCWVCRKSGHNFRECEELKNKPVGDRREVLEKLKICTSCLTRYCQGKCKFVHKCQLEGCNGLHPTLLHSVEESIQIHAGKDSAGTIIYRTMPVSLHAGQRSVSVVAFLDEGSSGTLLNAEVARKLDITGPTEPLSISWTKNISRNEEESMRISLKISAKGAKEKWQLINVRTVSDLMLPKPRSLASDVKKYRHLVDVPVSDHHEAPSMIIGLDNVELFAALETRIGNRGEPIAVRSRLGWTVYGLENRRLSYNVPVNHHDIQVMDNRTLHEMIGEQYRSEELKCDTNRRPPVSDEESRAQEILERTTRRIGDRFETGLLWRDDDPELPDSYPMAEKRMLQLAKRLDKNQDLGKMVQRKIEEYQTKGYAHEITNEELAHDRREPVWYLPLNVVQHAKKPGKIRLVWDAAASVGGVSLNSRLMKGPDLLVPLPKIICKFREKPIAFGGDVMEMFHQLQICEQDKQAQRFLFGTKPDGTPRTYVMDVATFGATCSPSSAQFVKNLNAKEFAEEFPQAALAIIENHYVDDYYDSADSIREAIQLAKAVRYVHSRGGFHLRNWVSNSKEVLEALGEQNSSSTIRLVGDKETMNNRVLGVLWDSKDDSFWFGGLSDSELDKYVSGARHPTKRIVLSVVMTQFDPIGFITPVTIRGKMLIQDLWRTGCDWDEMIDSEALGKWNNWVQALISLKAVKIARSYFGAARSDEVSDIQLHVFTDASEVAFGCVAYLRAVVRGQVHCSMVMSRSKVAPLKLMSIPRLELQAAVLGVRLAKTVVAFHRLTFAKRFFWTDAKVVLSWIRSDQRRYKQFVGLRVGEILDETSVEDWRWVPSNINVADVVTKWGKSVDLTTDSTWNNGPAFLYEDEENWPEQHRPELNTAEEMRVHLMIHDVRVPGAILDARRISKWTVLVRTVACVVRFVSNCRRKVKGEPIETLRATQRQLRSRLVTKMVSSCVPLRQDEYDKAEKILMKAAQGERFRDEITLLMKNKRNPAADWIGLDKGSPLAKLCPLIDESGLIRMEGRTERAECLPFGLRFPVILPDNHPITESLVQHYHEKCGHGYRETVKNELRCAYYVLHLDATVRKVSSNCVWCKVHRNQPKIPRMAPLPIQRLTPFLRAFSFTGVDYLGPFVVTTGRRTEKRWVALFTCLVTRAIHLEVASDLTTQACLMAIRRFICRRGWPLEFFSDNGTNFQGASKQIVGTIEENCADQLTNARTKWTFNPPAAPHMGGVWERLVRSVKGILEVLDDGRRLTDEILHTSLVEAEDIVNSRPLVTVSQQGSNEETLTPNHFLRGVLSRDERVVPPTNPKIALRDTYERSKQLGDIMWDKWIKEYAPTLNQRKKWFGDSRALAVGDLVYVVTGKCRKQWVRGTVEEVIVAADNRIRQAWVRTNNGRFKRAVSQLAVLEID